MKGVRSDVWVKHCGRDLTVVVIHSNEDGTERKVVCSAYFPSNSEDALPPQEIRDCEADGLDLVILCWSF